MIYFIIYIDLFPYLDICIQLSINVIIYRTSISVMYPVIDQSMYLYRPITIYVSINLSIHPESYYVLVNLPVSTNVSIVSSLSLTSPPRSLSL